MAWHRRVGDPMDSGISAREDFGGVSVLLSLKPQGVRVRLPTVGTRMRGRGQN